MAIRTRITDKFNLKWPIISAPMAGASGGNLAAEITGAGGLGMIGGGYGDPDFIARAWQDAGQTKTGIGFITWSLESKPQLLEDAISRTPPAIMLSFGDPSIFSRQIKDAHIALICQCQTITHVKQAMDAGADIIVAQGSEAGGHGAARSTFPLVPETADLLNKHSPDTLLLAAGGIGDGRGIAASLLLGADGVLIGTRFWATREALVPPAFQRAAINNTGDATMRTSVPDVARDLDWPKGFNIRVLQNRLMRQYHDRLENITPQEANDIAERYASAIKTGNIDDGGIIVGEVSGLINDLPAAATLLQRLGREAELVLEKGVNLVCQVTDP